MPPTTARRTLTVAALGTFLSLMVFTAPLATINATATSLETGVAGRTWVLSSMSVGLAAALLVAGALADDLGRRRIFTVGMVVLAAGSLAAAVAPHVLVFVLARVVEPVSKADTLRVLDEVGVAGPSLRTIFRALGRQQGGRDPRQQVRARTVVGQRDPRAQDLGRHRRGGRLAVRRRDEHRPGREARREHVDGAGIELPQELSRDGRPAAATKQPRMRSGGMAIPHAKTPIRGSDNLY